MKKRTLLLCLLFAALFVANANPVDQNSAKEIGAKFLTASVGMRASTADLTLAKTYRMDNGDAAFYVFSTLNGFVIVSAQDVATPILGYSDEGPFNVDDIPENMEWWLQDYAKQIQYCIENNVVPFEKTAHEWDLVKKSGKLSEDRALTAVGPLLTSTWHQNWPYNKFCPEAANTSPDLNGHKYAGCVACAMSQVMRKWNYPTQGYGEHTYNPSGSPQQSVNFGETTYQWANMPDNITNESPVEEIDAVATLMYHAGVAVDMYYAVSGSSCNDDSKVANAFKTYFLYSDELSLEELHSYTTSDYATWKVKLRSSLDHGFPVFYTAGDDNSPAGHAFVLDGYSNDGAFHINWGYSGAGNGYFPVGSFNTGGYHYNHAPCAIVNMHPQTQANGDPWPTTQFQIVVSSNGNGTVSGGNDYGFGASVTVSATANSGYSFAYWKEENVIVSTDKDYTFTAKYNRSLVAYFESPGTITVLPNDAAYGTVSGGGTYGVNENVSLSATANAGYIFENWTKDGMIVATDNPYSFKANGTATYVANFMPYEGEYIGNESTNASNGNVPNAVMYNYSISEQIYTKAEVGGSGDIYSIAFFNVGSTGNLNDVTRTLDIYMKHTDKAEFGGTSDSDWITANYDYLVFSGEVAFEYGTWTTIYLDTPFYYDGENNLVVIVNDGTGHTNTSHNFKTYYTGKYHSLYNRGSSSYNPANMSGITGSLRTTEKNKIIINKGTHTGNYTVTTTEIPEGAGTLTGAGSYAYGAECTVTATPGNESFVFRHWTKNGKIMSTNPTYTFTVKGNASMVAVFAGPGTVFTSVKPVGTGYVTGDGSFNYGTECTLTATPAPGYAFSKWTVNGEIVSTDPTYSFTVTEDISVVANFRSIDMIEFIDSRVKELCVEEWDTNGDGEISMTEAAAVTTIGEKFKDHIDITTFNEFQYFTNLTEIPAAAFRGCNRLTEVTMPNSIMTIENAAFSGCTQLSSIVIPNSVTQIKANAFNNCGSLDGLLIIPSSVTFIGTDAFRNCSGIDVMIVKCPTPPTVNSVSAFEDWDFSIPVYVVGRTAYSGTAGWSQFTNLIEQKLTSSVSALAENDVLRVNSNYTLNTSASCYYMYFSDNRDGNVFTIDKDGVLSVTEAIETTSASQLVVKDGAQLICKNNPAVTVQKNIQGWENVYPADSWYFIASPLSDNYSPSGIMLSNTYDLYRLNPSNTMWENFKESTGGTPNAASGFDLVNGRGYLYANNSETNLLFEGTIKPFASTQNVSVSTGWNLIGNPFTYDVYANQNYYKMNNDGTGIASVTKGTETIAPCMGIVVNSPANGSVTFSKELPLTSSNDQGGILMELTQTVTTRGNIERKTIDNAIISFNVDSRLPKFYFGTANANIYISQGKEEYAIVSAQAQGEMPICIKTNQDGQYILTVKAEDVEMGYLHLIDNVTGANIDLKANPNYTFNAKADNYESRFRLVFSANTVNTETSDDFAFISNGQIIVNGEGTIQVIDLTGRIVISEDNARTVSTTEMVPGVYVMRLIGANGTKIQKIMIK